MEGPQPHQATEAKPVADAGSTKAPATMAHAMLAMAAARPDNLAVVVAGGRNPATSKRSYKTWTYAQLADEAQAVALGLRAAGFRTGERTVLMVPPSPEFYALSYGLLLAGTVPVLIDPGLGRRQLTQCLKEAQPTAFVGIRLAQAASVALDWGRDTVVRRVTVGGQSLGWGGHTLDEITALGRADGAGANAAPLLSVSPDDVAAIAFTSGSTGVAKGVLYKHKHFLAQVDMIRDSIGAQPGHVNMPTFAPFALFDPALGTTALLPDMNWRKPAAVDPAMLLELIHEWQVNNVFGSPALFTTVVRHATQHGIKWPDCVRCVLSAGAPVPVSVLEGMTALLPEQAQFMTPYGATECLPICAIGGRELLGDTCTATEAGAGVCVGRPVGTNDVRIIAITEEPIAEWQDAVELPPGQVGEITVLGPTTTEAYLNRKGANAAAKIRAPDGRTIHRMGDVGYLDTQGRLWYCGRKSHRVVLAGGRTLYTAQVEEVLNAHPAVFRTGVVGVKGSDGATLPVVCVELERHVQHKPSKAKLFSELQAMCDAHAATKGIQTFLVHPGLPVDIRHNSKITRELLGPWAARKLAARGATGCGCGLPA